MSTQASTIASLFNSENDTPPELVPPVTDPVIDPVDPVDPIDPVDPVEPPAEEDPEGTDPEGDDDAPEALGVEEFFSTLDQMHGTDINSEIDYEGVDPLTPEGQFRRESHIADKARSTFEQTLKERDPRGYAYLIHRSNGGADSDFFSRSSFVLPELSAMADDIDLQKDVYERILLSRGNSPKQASALIKIAAEDGELATEAQNAWTAMRAQEKSELDQATQISQQNEERTSRDLNEFGAVINNSILSNDALRFVIPEADKVKFADEFKGLVHYEDGKFFMVKELNKDNLSKVMESELFSYVGGNLNKLVEKKATTLAAKRTINRVRNANSTPKSTGSGPASGASLGSIL